MKFLARSPMLIFYIEKNSNKCMEIKAAMQLSFCLFLTSEVEFGFS